MPGFFHPLIFGYPIGEKRSCQLSPPTVITNMARRRIPPILLCIVLLPFTALASDSDIFISEVQITGVKADDEFIRLSNTTESTIDLTGFKLSKKSLSSGTCKESALVSEKGFTGMIKPKGTFIISHPLYKEAHHADLTYSSDSYYITDNTVILLYDKHKKLIDRKAVGSVCDETTPPPSIPNTYDIRINEVFPNPLDEDDEWVELFNFGSETVSLKGWALSDKTKSYPFTESDSIASKEFFILPRKKSNIALNNTSETLALSDASHNIVSQISYEKTIEGASFNSTPTGYRWSKTITPGAENILNTVPETKRKDIPDIAYQNVLTTFSASGKDTDGDNIKYTWDFGDGHKSYKGKATHRYEEEGKYEGTLTISDGTESNVTTFTVEVEKYDAPKVRMTTLVPNPAGRDTDTEYIIIENRSKKSVDLLGWSIATGWKKLVNHPIRESFMIAKKSKRNLTHDFSAFTLPNEKGRVELRSPDGETVQKLKYNLKGKSAEENALLVKEKGGGWKWVLPQLTENSRQTTLPTADAPPEGGTTAVVDREEKQLKQDTERITLRKNQGEELLSTETNALEEMRRLIGFGTDIETPIAVLALAPQVAGASDELPPSGRYDTDADFDLNALINHWLE